MFISGNQAIAAGCKEAGAYYLAGYPITPSTDIMVNWLNIISYKERTFIQTEDEIAAIHNIIGASLAGKKAFTTTSGPGFSLMQEGIGLAYVYQIPLVLFNVMRQGPSTGMPTLFSQDSLLQTQYGTHGDHIAITFYPNSVQECYDLTIKSFNAACESSSPVILASDAYLARMYENAKYHHDISIAEFPFKGLGQGKRHYTGLTNDDGIPDTKNAKTFHKWMKKINDPIIKTAKKYELYEYTKCSKSNVLLIAFGILSRVVAEWQDEYSLFRPIRIFPVLEKALIKVSKKYDDIVVVEGNQGQYATLVESVLKRPVKRVPVLGGEINPNKIRRQINKLVGN